jgi:hypothetical protein
MLVSIPENAQGEMIAGANARARLSKDHKGTSTEREGGREEGREGEEESGKWKRKGERRGKERSRVKSEE